MKFVDSGLAGAWIVEYEPARDERGAFTERWERETFGRRGLFTSIDQASCACNRSAGTLRGMHFQRTPFEQAKLVSCSAGAVYDVIVDLRPVSPTYRHWRAFELRAHEPRALYIPAGFAHGYLTLREDTTVDYLISGKYSPEYSQGVRWNDPAFGIAWPAAPTVIAPRDAQYTGLHGMSGKRVLLTGGSGFIGRHCIADLQARGYEVHATTTGRATVSDGVRWHHVDLLNGDETAALLAELRPDSLLHLAWYAEHGLFWQALENLDWVRAGIALMRAFIAAGGRRAVFAGSCAEYDWTDGHCREDVTSLRPQGLYGVAKHAFHLIAEAAARRAGISCAWGRIFFLYGPAEQPGRLVPLIVRSQLRGERVACNAGGLQRDYMYVADVASALVALLDSPLEGAVNIGSGCAVSIRAMVERIVVRTGRPELVDFAARAPAREEVPLVVADTTRLAGELGWAPRTDIECGLDLTIDWWRQHPDSR